MSSYTINGFELTRQVFGINGFVPILGNPSSDIQLSGDIETIEVADAIATSVFGTPIFESITLIDPNDTSQRLEFDDAPMISVNKANIIVKTNVQGRSGSVKEFITESDYSITVRGILVNHNAEDLPYDRINRLNRFAKITQALQVESRLLNALDIHNLVIDRVQYSDNGNYSNVQPYQLSCTSDLPIELTL